MCSYRRTKRDTKQTQKDTKRDTKDGEKLKEEVSACQQFLVDVEMQNGTENLFEFQKSELDTKTINEKHEEVLNKLESAAKINIALGVVLGNFE